MPASADDVMQDLFDCGSNENFVVTLKVHNLDWYAEVTSVENRDLYLFNDGDFEGPIEALADVMQKLRKHIYQTSADTEASVSSPG